MKATNILIGIVFIAFALLQLNDPDPLVWVSMYGVVAILAIARLFGLYHKNAVIVLMSALAVYALFLIPDVVAMFSSDNPSEIFGEMIYDKPHIEGSREFLGLMIAELALLVQFVFK